MDPRKIAADADAYKLKWVDANKTPDSVDNEAEMSTKPKNPASDGVSVVRGGPLSEYMTSDQARRDELKWALSQAPSLHEESDQVDKWEAEHYKELLAERLAALEQSKQ